MERDSEFSKQPKAAERILDRANGNPCQRQCRAIASKYIRGLLIGIKLTDESCRENTRSRQRQTLSEIVSGDDIEQGIRSLPNSLKLQ